MSGLLSSRVLVFRFGRSRESPVVDGASQVVGSCQRLRGLAWRWRWAGVEVHDQDGATAWTVHPNTAWPLTRRRYRVSYPGMGDVLAFGGRHRGIVLGDRTLAEFSAGPADFGCQLFSSEGKGLLAVVRKLPRSDRPPGNLWNRAFSSGWEIEMWNAEISDPLRRLLCAAVYIWAASESEDDT